MGRAPCCDKNGLKKGPWTPEEDKKLIDYIHKHGYGNWRTLPKNADLQRCGKSCRLRWTNYLRPDIKRGRFSFEEEETIIHLHSLLGNKWSSIAARLPGRTDNEIKNYWNTHIRKRLLRMGIDPVTHSPRLDLLDLSTIMCNSSFYNTMRSSSSQTNMFGLQQQQQPLLNPELLKIAASLLSTHSNGQNPNSSSIEDLQVNSNSQIPINFEEYPTNIPNFDDNIQNYNQWQSHGLALEGLINIDHNLANLSYYIDQTPMDPSISDLQSNTSGQQSFMSFPSSVISTPSSSPSSLTWTSSSNSVYINNNEMEERDNYYCSDMVKFEILDTFDGNQFVLPQNC